MIIFYSMLGGRQGRQFALKVGFAQWYINDQPYYYYPKGREFCETLEEYKGVYKNWYDKQQIKQKLEFTKFYCGGDENESCKNLKQWDDVVRKHPNYC